MFKGYFICFPGPTSKLNARITGNVMNVTNIKSKDVFAIQCQAKNTHGAAISKAFILKSSKYYFYFHLCYGIIITTSPVVIANKTERAQGYVDVMTLYYRYALICLTKT